MDGQMSGVGEGWTQGGMNKRVMNVVIMKTINEYETPTYPR